MTSHEVDAVLYDASGLSDAPSEGARTIDQVAAKKKVLNRLKRAHGQLSAVINAVESDSDCRTVVTQLAAVSSAVERAGFAIVASGMKHCLISDAESTERTSNSTDDTREKAGLTIEELERLFMMLS
ncbi:MAG: metal-sensitive transcriptional regulator [Propionibacteriaceae bacterium]|nr:metal-sensitive transcriptional regulator [Propionibacteriaceae bacterium]